MYLSEEERFVSTMDVENAKKIFADKPHIKRIKRKIILDAIKDSDSFYHGVKVTILGSSKISKNFTSKEKRNALALFLLGSAIIYEAYGKRWPLSDSRIDKSIGEIYEKGEENNIWLLYDLISKKAGKFLNIYRFKEETLNPLSGKTIVQVRWLLAPLYKAVNLKPSIPLRFN